MYRGYELLTWESRLVGVAVWNRMLSWINPNLELEAAGDGFDDHWCCGDPTDQPGAAGAYLWPGDGWCCEWHGNRGFCRGTLPESGSSGI
ncbi:hypothetical protein ACTM9N_06825 [Lachnospiraceae bacterium HCP1S3_A8]